MISGQEGDLLSVGVNAEVLEAHPGRANVFSLSAFDRDTPVWLAGNYHERWNLPRVDQGTGMDPAIAYALRFPMPEEFDEYIKAVQDAVVSRIAGQSDEYLQTFLNIRPWGSLSRAEAIMHGLIGHGNGHLGRISYLRDMWGLKGLGY